MSCIYWQVGGGADFYRKSSIRKVFEGSEGRIEGFPSVATGRWGPGGPTSSEWRLGGMQQPWWPP